MESPVRSSPGADRRPEVDQVPEPKLMTLKGARSNPVLPWWPGNAQDRRSSPRFRRRPAKVRNRRVSPVAARSSDRLLSEPRAGTQPLRREPLFMVHIRHRPIRKKIADTLEFEIAAHDPYRRWHAGIWQFGQNHSTAAAENPIPTPCSARPLNTAALDPPRLGASRSPIYPHR
jgi:hypothetical protein